MKTDWIPSSIPNLAALCRFWLTLLLSERIPADFHWDAALCKGAADKIKAFLDACDACADLDTTYHLNLRRETRAAAVKAMRAFAASSVRGNPYMTDADREKMGLRKPDTVHTSHPRPESQPVTAAENTRNNYEHRVSAVNRENNSATKPADAYGVRFAWKTGGERPASGDDLPKSRFSRKTAITVAHSEPDKGKPAWYACCYENAKGEQGPWSPVVEAYIA